MAIAYYFNEETLAQRIQGLLNRAHLDCEAFLSEESLLRTLRWRAFELILLDASVFIHNQEQMLSSLYYRSLESLPIVVLSALPIVDHVAYVLNSGAENDSILPENSAESVAHLRAAIHRYRSERKNARQWTRN